jgi:hypothetical protein
MQLTDAATAPEVRGEQPSPLVEGQDFYFDQGRFVLTEGYLLRRGECCDNGCRHCPYRATSTGME